ncbi:SIMPL domain-containing protein [Haloplanus sp. C73]|uniref:SIMPL domain-containing protein n=1 Tax=Haloplanus sp. C73 TaxID=3421641 RepID=UPI003EBF1613
MKRTLALTLAIVVLLAGCTTPLQADAGESGDESTIAVSATGAATADPDLAIVSLSVEAAADSAAEARSRVATDVASVRSALAGANVTTTGFLIEPIYETDGERRTMVGYRARHSLAAETTPENVGEVIDRAVDSGATSVDGVQFTLSDDQRASLRATAFDRAMSAARTDADGLASTADLTITGVRQVSTGAEFLPYAGARFEDATTLEPGPVTVQVSVDVTYAAA